MSRIRGLTLEFIQSQSASYVELVIEETTDHAPWSTTTIEYGPSKDNGNGTMPRRFRSSQIMQAGDSGYLRLKAKADGPPVSNRLPAHLLPRIKICEKAAFS